MRTILSYIIYGVSLWILHYALGYSSGVLGVAVTSAVMLVLHRVVGIIVYIPHVIMCKLHIRQRANISSWWDGSMAILSGVFFPIIVAVSISTVSYIAAIMSTHVHWITEMIYLHWIIYFSASYALTIKFLEDDHEKYY